jgi:4-hydroxyphenylpyruvate dioxygenase
MLHGQGFRRSHRHRSKDVELYRQGEVNLVVNFEDEGFPHAFYLLHGPDRRHGAACRQCRPRRRTRHGNARQAVRRADRQRRTRNPRRARVSGSLVYFSDQASRRGALFEVDFVLDPEPEAPPGPGLTRVDHVAQVVPEAKPTPPSVWQPGRRSIGARRKS